MANGVMLTPRGVERIRKVVRRVEGMRDSRAGDRTTATPTDTEFWALLTGVDVTGLRYTFLRVFPEASTDKADFAIGKDLAYRFASAEPEEGFARESNGNKGVPT